MTFEFEAPLLWYNMKGMVLTMWLKISFCIEDTDGRVHVDEELAICLTANWLLLRLRFAKQAKLLPGVCAGFYYCCSWALAFTFGRPLISALAFLATLPAPPLRTTLLPTPLATALLSDLGESGGHRTRKRESRRRRKERRLPHKSHSSYNMCRSLLCYARLAGGRGRAAVEANALWRLPQHPALPYRKPSSKCKNLRNINYVLLKCLRFLSCCCCWLHPQPGYRSLALLHSHPFEPHATRRKMSGNSC